MRRFANGLKHADKVSWLAARGGIQGRGAVQRWRSLHPIERRIESFHAFSRWGRLGISSGHMPVVSGHPFGTALVPNPSPSSSSPSPPFDRAQLPMWPSARFQWPQQGVESPPTSWCATWIWLDQTCMTRAVWKWWSVDSPFSGVFQ